MTYGPTSRQMDFLRFVRGYQISKGVSPTYAEIARGLKIRRGHAHEMFAIIEERGLAKAPTGKHRSIELLMTPTIPRAPDGAPLYFVRVPQ